MKNTLLYTHLGMGDMIICNGIVREYLRLHNNVTIFCKKIYKDSVEFMYRDLQNIHIIYVDGWEDAYNYIQENLSRYNVETIGYEKMNPYIRNQESFDRQFYKLAKLDFGLKYKNFYVKRNPSLEIETFDKFQISGDYIFLHEDIDRNILIDKNKINKKYKIICPDKKVCNNIFGYLKLIESAKEIHCIDSCFLSLIDIMKLNNNIFFHRYARINIYKNDKFCESFAVPSIDKNWIIID